MASEFEHIGRKSRERFEQDINAVESVLTNLEGKDFEIDDIRRVGTYNSENKNPRTINPKLVNQGSRRLMLQSTHKLAT